MASVNVLGRLGWYSAALDKVPFSGDECVLLLYLYFVNVRVCVQTTYSSARSFVDCVCVVYVLLGLLVTL